MFLYPHDQLRRGVIQLQSLHTISQELLDTCGYKELKKTTFGLLQIESEINTFEKYECNPQHFMLTVT